MVPIIWPMYLKEESEEMNKKGIVNKIIPFSNVDGPGNRLAIFFQGCNIKCVYCHNPETINNCINCMECITVCPKAAITDLNGEITYREHLCIACDSCIKKCKYNSSPRTTEYSLEELIEIIEGYRPFIRGITVSGGEPTLQSEFIEELFKRVRLLGLSCFVDTNAFFNRDKIKGLINTSDKFMVDIKAIDELMKLCATEFDNNIDNLKYLLALDKVYEVRTVIIMEYMDGLSTVEKVGKILKDYPDVNYKLIRVHLNGLSLSQRELVKDHIPSIEYMELLKNRLYEIGVSRVEVIN